MPLSYDAQLLILGAFLGAVLAFVFGLIGYWFKHRLDKQEYERRRKQEQAEKRFDELKESARRYRGR